MGSRVMQGSAGRASCKHAPASCSTHKDVCVCVHLNARTDRISVDDNNTPFQQQNVLSAQNCRWADLEAQYNPSNTNAQCVTTRTIFKKMSLQKTSTERPLQLQLAHPLLACFAAAVAAVVAVAGPRLPRPLFP
eukprot:537186-Pelagomonas_calceolata.AAC.1